MKFTVITKDGSKWLSRTAPHGVDPIQWHSDNLDLPYIGASEPGTSLSEEQVSAIYQTSFDGVSWIEVTYDDYIDKGERYPVRIAYTDADPPDIDYEKEMPHKEWPSTKYTARKVDAESHDRHISDDYWRKRCEAAERYINESPCDPDITPAQEAAYDAWQEIVKQQPK